MRTVLAGLGAALLVAVLGACGDDGSGTSGDGPHIVVTTNILGDVVEEIVGDAGQVEVLMPPGQDPHDIAPSPRQVATMREADVLIENGAGFEVALADAIDAAREDGVTVLSAIDGVSEELRLDDGTGDVDPHFFADPARMHQAVAYLADALREERPELANDEFGARVVSYLGDLDTLDEEAAAALAAIPPDRRLLVTNHDVLGYFAERYDFEVVGVIIPGGSTLAEPSAADLADLAAAIDAAGVPAIFAETSSPARLAKALANEGTGVDVIELHTESLTDAAGEAPTYLELIRSNVDAIVAALGGTAG